MEVALIFAGIVVLFALLLIVKKISRWRFCALCASISLTWITLLVLLWLGRFDDPVLVALLMGQSVVGLYYLAEKNLRSQLMVFRLAGLLSLTYLAYGAVAEYQVYPVALLVGLWLMSGVLFFYRNNPRLKSTVDHIVACCRDW